MPDDGPQDVGAEAADAGSARPQPEPSRDEEAAAGRHLTNAILVNLMHEVRHMGGDELAERVLRRAGENRAVWEQAFLLGWSTVDQAIALFEAAMEETGDLDIPYRAGQWTFRVLAMAEFFDKLRLLAGPGALLSLIGPLAARVTTITDAEAVEVGDRHAVLRYVTRPPHSRHPILCRYTEGTLSSFATVFGLPFGDVAELACQTRGNPHCVYRVTWDPASEEAVDPDARIAALEERIEALSTRFQDLQRVGTALSVTHDVTAVLDTVVHLAGVAVNAPHHVLAAHLPGERAPRLHAVGLSDERARELAADMLSSDSVPVGPGSWEGVRLVVDVATSRRRYGRLAAYAFHEFLPGDDRLLGAYAGHAAAALEAAVAFDETRLLLEFSAQLADIASSAEMTARITQAALRVVASDRAAVLLFEPADGLLVRSAVARWSTGGADGTSANGSPGDGAAAGAPAGPVVELVATGRSVAANGARGVDHQPAPSADGAAVLAWALASHGQPTAAWEDPLLVPVQRAAGCRRGIAIPLVARRQFLGVLVLEAAEDDLGIDEDVARRVAGVANLAASALHSARLLEMVQHQANHDILTGLPNARLFSDRLTVALAACRRSGSSLAVLFVDLDGFKDVNDRLGHTAGDRVLCEVANRLRHTVREVDSVARLGGDEFVILVPELASGQDAQVARDRVAAALASGPVRVRGVDVPLRASIGMALYPEDGSSPGDLLHRADVAMYRKKLSRRTTRS